MDKGIFPSSVLVNVVMGTWEIINGAKMVDVLISTGSLVLNAYLVLWVLGAVTTVAEWRRVRTSDFKKIIYVFSFPLFMMTYIPVSIAACFTKVEWKPIDHDRHMELVQSKRPEDGRSTNSDCSSV